jgi:superfamily II DNA helicase RecQ
MGDKSNVRWVIHNLPKISKAIIKKLVAGRDGPSETILFESGDLIQLQKFFSRIKC